MGGDAYYTPHIWESVCQGVLVFAMSSPSILSSCDEDQPWGWTWNDLSLLGLYVWPLVGSDWGELGFGPLFFSCNNHVAWSIRVFNDVSGIRGRWLVCRLLVRLRSGVTVLA